jgi:Ribonuclease G/E
MSECPRCKGEGMVTTVVNTRQGIVIYQPCPYCKGTGEEGDDERVSDVRRARMGDEAAHLLDAEGIGRL